MTIELALAWFLTFFPITISPGPANILLSSTAAQFGVRRTLPVMWGIVAVFALQIAVVAIGIGEILLRYPSLVSVFKLAGALYLFYLAYKFFRASGLTVSNRTQLGFRAGALLQVVNFKAFSVPLIMYTQFLNPETATRVQNTVLTIALFGLIISSLLAWVIGGSLLQRFFQSEFGIKWQGKLFGTLLAGVAVWVLLK